MMILTRSRRIRTALRKVQARIPTKEWQAIASFLAWIRADSGWQKTAGLMSELDKAGGALFPLYNLDVDVRQQKNPRGQIRFTLPVCRLYSDRALIGLVAHELAHAVRAAGLGPGWWEKMDCRYPAEERIADDMVARWGLRFHIRSMRHEQRTFVVPLLERREPKIMRLLERRSREDKERGA